jgi:mRNA interferase MazF
MKRGEIYWGDLGQAGRRPALIVTRSSAIAVRTRVTVAPITRTIRGIRSEVPVGQDVGLPDSSVASCDNLVTVDKRVLDPDPVGLLTASRIRVLDAALKFALGIRA